MEIITNITEDVIKKAAKALKDGNLVAFPTETVYGLGADATNETAVGRIYSVKGRPANHPLIVHISSVNQINKWAIDIPDYALKLATKFWPGPMTLILKRNKLAKNFITGGQDNVGLRVPNQLIALALLNEFELLGGLGLAAPSANRFGAISPTTSLAVHEEIGEYLDSNDLILDGSRCNIGVESTIIDCTTDIPTILRPGAITSKMIQKSLGIKITENYLSGVIKASGRLASHYSPKAKVTLNKLAEFGEGMIAMANIPTPKGAFRLASPKNIEEYANILYEALRDGDRKKLTEIKVILPEEEGLAEAIKDRITKSAQKVEQN